MLKLLRQIFIVMPVFAVLTFIFWVDEVFKELGRLFVATVFLTLYAAEWLQQRFRRT